MKALWIGLMMLLTLIGLPGQALAHSVQTNYLSASQAQLEVQAVFSTGEPFAMAPVKVYTPIDLETPWLEGTTDTDGHFAFVPDQAIQGDWKIRIGELDHGDILLIPVNASGIEVEEFSDFLLQTDHNNQFLVLGFALSSGLGATLLSRRWRQ